MTCKCSSDNIIRINGKCSDMCMVDYKGKSQDGYVPGGIGVGGGDYIDFRLCLNCGRIQDSFPKEFSLDNEETEE